MFKKNQFRWIKKKVNNRKLIAKIVLDIIIWKTFAIAYEIIQFLNLTVFAYGFFVKPKDPRFNPPPPPKTGFWTFEWFKIMYIIICAILTIWIIIDLLRIIFGKDESLCIDEDIKVDN